MFIFGMKLHSLAQATKRSGKKADYHGAIDLVGKARSPHGVLFRGRRVLTVPALSMPSLRAWTFSEQRIQELLTQSHTGLVVEGVS
jgi:hypothetical protein